MDDEDLAQRVQSLPPELFNIVLAEVFTPDTTTHKIDANYKPPKFLAVSRTTRETYAKAYYGGLDSSFVFELAVGKPIEPLYRWLKCLPLSHLRMLSQVKLVWTYVGVVRSSRHSVASRMVFLKRRVKAELDAAGPERAEDRLCVKFYGTDVDGQAFVCRA